MKRKGSSIMHSSNQNIPLTSELFGILFVNSLSTDDLLIFESCPEQIFNSAFGFDMDNKTIDVTVNTSKVFNLCLPYYDSLNNNQLNEISDSDMTNIVGGVSFFHSDTYDAFLDDPHFNRIGIFEKG